MCITTPTLVFILVYIISSTIIIISGAQTTIPYSDYVELSAATSPAPSPSSSSVVTVTAVVSDVSARSIGFLSRIAGSTSGESGITDGIGDNVRFGGITALALNHTESSQVIIADGDNHCIRRLHLSTRLVTTLCGQCGSHLYGHINGGCMTTARFNGPQGVAIWSAMPNIVYVSDTNNHCIRRIDIDSSLVTDIAGMCTTAGYIDGNAATAKFWYPTAIATSDEWQSIAIADRFNHRIRLLNVTSMQVSTIAGNGTRGHVDSSTPSTTTVSFPTSVVFVKSKDDHHQSNRDRLFFAQSHQIREIVLSSASAAAIASATTVRRVGHATEEGYVDGAGIPTARLYSPMSITATANGDMMVVDQSNIAIRYINSSSFTVITASRLHNSIAITATQPQTGLLDSAGFVAPACIVGGNRLGGGKQMEFFIVADRDARSLYLMSSSCRTDPCQFNGTCTSNMMCTCEPGYLGEQCDIPTCVVPCTNGQICKELNSCACPDGYTGVSCVDPICTTPCVNGACTLPDTCTCSAGWTGSTCAEPVCSSPCEHGGTCSSPDLCSCPAEWTGSFCADPVCSPTCSNGGDCISPNVCNCTAQWQGATCQTPVCPNPCQNGGSCTAPGVCTCTSGWNGTTCSEATCSPPCLNSGICTSPGVCTCTTGWQGTICETPVCNQTCLNDGICSAPNTCTCSTGWSGANCSTPVCSPACSNVSTCTAPDTCTSVCSFGCLNGATCIAPELCACTPGYYGDDCSLFSCTPDCDHGRCTAPDTCTCDAGWNGTACEAAICTLPCQNGASCVLPETCDCINNWLGADCSIAHCNGATDGCFNGAPCTSPDLCSCLTGYQGALCSTAICSVPCQNGGKCTAPETCQCRDGFDGAACEKELTVQQTFWDRNSYIPDVAIAIVVIVIAGSAAWIVRKRLDRKRQEEFEALMIQEAQKVESSDGDDESDYDDAYDNYVGRYNDTRSTGNRSLISRAMERRMSMRDGGSGSGGDDTKVNRSGSGATQKAALDDWEQKFALQAGLSDSDHDHHYHHMQQQPGAGPSVAPFQSSSPSHQFARNAW
jgi:Human growth factor-like EGF